MCYSQLKNNGWLKTIIVIPIANENKALSTDWQISVLKRLTLELWYPVTIALICYFLLVFLSRSYSKCIFLSPHLSDVSKAPHLLFPLIFLPQLTHTHWQGGLATVTSHTCSKPLCSPLHFASLHFTPKAPHVNKGWRRWGWLRQNNNAHGNPRPPEVDFYLLHEHLAFII